MARPVGRADAHLSDDRFCAMRLLAPLRVLQDRAAPLVLHEPPLFDLIQGAKTADADIAVIEAAIAYARRLDGSAAITHRLTVVALGTACEIGSRERGCNPRHGSRKRDHQSGTLSPLEIVVGSNREFFGQEVKSMPLALYGHPFSSYTQKVLIALYENATPFEFRCLEREFPEHSAELRRRWPPGKFPLLVDGDRNVAETSIIIEYLQLVHPGPVRLLPADPMTALAARFLDRFFDLHVMNVMQGAVEGALTGDSVKRREGLALAEKKLELAYGWLEGQLAGRPWAAGEDFTLADCAEAPSLFYADWTQRISEAFPLLRAYRARLLARPSFARAVNEARPFRGYFPLGAPERD
jgi:glutathione S-transferase